MLQFTKPLSYLNASGDHNELAEKYKDCKCFSVIVFRQLLDDDLYDDPKHIKKTNHLLYSRSLQEAINIHNSKWLSDDQIQQYVKDFNINVIDDTNRTDKLTNITNADYPYHSIIQQQAIKQLTTKWYSNDEIKHLLQEFEIQSWKNNQDPEENAKFALELMLHIYQAQVDVVSFQLLEQHKTETQDWDNELMRLCLPRNIHKNELIDEFFLAQIHSLSFKILERHKESCKFKTDENDEYVEAEGELIELSEEEFQEKWMKELLRLCLPKSIVECERNYSYMPVPFCRWDGRNPWQQFFFVETENEILQIHGGSGSSAQREHNGLFAHMFATLTKNYNHVIPTHIYFYTNRNEFEHIKRYDSFKTMSYELSGNYQMTNFSIINDLFKGLLIEYKIDYETNEITIEENPDRD